MAPGKAHPYKRGTGRGAFIDSVLELVDAFYGDVLQHLKAWSAAPPRMRDAVTVIPEQPAVLTSTALSSQDGPEPADGPDRGSGEPNDSAASPSGDGAVAGALRTPRGEDDTDRSD